MLLVGCAEVKRTSEQTVDALHNLSAFHDNIIFLKIMYLKNDKTTRLFNHALNDHRFYAQTHLHKYYPDEMRLILVQIERNLPFLSASAHLNA